MCIPCDKTISSVPKFLTLWPSPLTFDLHFTNFNLDHNFWTVRDRAFIFHMCTPYDKTFPSVPNVLTLTVTFDLHFKNFNLDHNFWTVRDRAFIFHMCIPWQDLSISTKMFDLVILTWRLTYILKTLTLIITFEP